ncbi:alpha/beta fold hydrolase [Kerstersia similis]|uniref:alpha/beta fold hydrolase n=1 Tax=Kerstersia similis TaxID=206505 RepID=UPI0039EDF7AC
MSATIVSDDRIDTPQGQLAVRQWQPAQGRAGLAPIVLLHDSLGCIALWRDFPERLAAATGRCVIAYDRLGFGQSDPHPGQLSMDYVQDEARTFLPQVLARLQAESFVALGHSIGGCMGIASAAQHAHCQGLIAIAAQAYVDDRIVAGIVEARDMFADPAQFARLERYHGAQARWVLESWAGTWTSSSFSSWNLDTELPQVQCPALVLHGDRDEYGSLAQPQRIAERVGGPVTLTVLEDCGHIPHREKPEVLLGTIGPWLARIG